MDKTLYVVGSGPAGIACAQALLQRGFSVTMLDAGMTLEPERQQLVDRVYSLPRNRWDPAIIQEIRGGLDSSTAGVALKLPYRSDYPYQDTNRFLPLVADRVMMRTSLAQGGLSTVWGAAMLPYRVEDIADWPITVDDLTPHYRAVLETLPYAAQIDNLASIYPLYVDHCQNLQPSKQAQALLENLHQYRHTLNKQHIYFGRSRLAVHAEDSADRYGCAYCGLCFSGCPYKLIYNAAYGLVGLKQFPNFHYLGDIIVEQIAESETSVSLQARSRIDGQPVQLRGERAFLACGVLASTKIMLRSMGEYNRAIQMRDSAYFLQPLLQYQRVPDVIHEDLHTLAQVYLEILDPLICSNTIHLQIYTYADVYLDVIRKLTLNIPPATALAARLLLGRLMIIQGYLHSEYSHGITLYLSNDSAHTLYVSKVMNLKTKPTIRKILRKLWNNRQQLGFIPVTPMLRMGEPGRGFHYGGTFPMQEEPRRFESDIWGRPYGFKRVYMVDSSSFPSIPSTTITLSMMANSRRIASTFEESV